MCLFTLLVLVSLDEFAVEKGWGEKWVASYLPPLLASSW